MAKRLSFHKCAIQELTRGHELAKKLKSQLELPGHHELATGLSSEVLQTFTTALSLIKSNRTELKAKKMVKCSATGDRNQRVSKRRREMNSRTEVTPVPYLDGFQWRKYGQKKIHNANHPRTYYRCTHSRDQECPARKQVQQQDDQYGDSAPMFLVIYNNKHTCTTTTELPPPQIILDSQAEQKCNFSILEAENSHPNFTNAAQKVFGEMLSPENDVCAPSIDHTKSLDLTSLGTTEMAEEVPTNSSLEDMDTCLMSPFHFLNSYGCDFDELSNLFNSIV